MHIIGSTIRAKKEGFYGCGYTPYEEHSQDWGLTTVDEKHNRLFLHVFDWPVDGVVWVDGLVSGEKRATLCATGHGIKFDSLGPTVHIHGDRSQPVPFDTVIRCDLEGPIKVDKAKLGEINDGGIPMQASRAHLAGVQKEKPVEGASNLPFQIGGKTY